MASRKRRRVRRRNSWFGARKRHQKAALKGRRSRRRARNSGRRRRYSRGRSRYARRFNPASLVGSLTSGFNVNTLKTAGVLVAGGIGNSLLSGQLINLIPVPFLQSGAGSYGTRLLSAGLLSGIVNMVAPQYSGAVLTGAVMQVGLKAISEFKPEWSPIQGLGDYLTLPQVRQARPLAGLGDYLTSNQVAQARPLMTGMGGMGYGDDWLQGAADSFENGAF